MEVNMLFSFLELCVLPKCERFLEHLHLCAVTADDGQITDFALEMMVASRKGCSLFRELHE
jgi:hypothetical protein